MKTTAPQYNPNSFNQHKRLLTASLYCRRIAIKNFSFISATDLISERVQFKSFKTIQKSSVKATQEAKSKECSEKVIQKIKNVLEENSQATNSHKRQTIKIFTSNFDSNETDQKKNFSSFVSC